MSIAGWLPPEWSKAILPIAIRVDTDKYTPIGTSFLISFGGLGLNCLITAKHVVFDEHAQRRTGLFMLNNVLSGGMIAKSFDALFDQGVQWIPHPEKDIAATVCPMVQSRDDFRGFTEGLFEDFGNVREGDDIFFLGFPLRIVTPSRITPMVRGGMVALKHENDTFLIEANAFPGNSGSPVFFKPSPFGMTPKGLSLGNVRQSKLIGVITASVSYRDVAISQQTGRPRIIFEENSGLADVLSMRFIREILNSPNFNNMVQSVRERATGGERTTD